MKKIHTKDNGKNASEKFQPVQCFFTDSLPVFSGIMFIPDEYSGGKEVYCD